MDVSTSSDLEIVTLPLGSLVYEWRVATVSVEFGGRFWSLSRASVQKSKYNLPRQRFTMRRNATDSRGQGNGSVGENLL